MPFYNLHLFLCGEKSCGEQATSRSGEMFKILKLLSFLSRLQRPPGALALKCGDISKEKMSLDYSSRCWREEG
jgi:hypothetical protein